MAFRTNKTPAIEERTVSGSSVTFNSAFALPLKACKVSFSATESGSGTKSPSNPYTINGVSGLNLSANSVPVSVNFGDTYYGGELDVLNGVLTVTHAILELDGSDDEVYTDYSSYNGFTMYVQNSKSGTNLPCMANWLKSQVSFDEFGLRIGANSPRFYFLHITDNISGITNIATWRAYLSQHLLEIVYELAEPITIQLSPTQLSSITGSNTFSTDTGTLEITFADLQEKSASGSIATFNTALAMPLVNGEFSIEAYQEGTGDPSPVNKRNIVPRREVNICNTSGLAEWFKGIYQGVYGFIDLGGQDISWGRSSSGYFSSSSLSSIIKRPQSSNIKANIICVKYATETASHIVSSPTSYDKSIGVSATNGNMFVVDTDYDNADDFKAALSGVYLIYELATPTTPTITEAQFNALLSSFNINGAHYLVNLGEDTYGAVYNSVTGKLTLTHEYIFLDENYPNISLYSVSNKHGVAFGGALSQISTRVSGLTNMGKVVTSSSTSGGSFWLGVNSKTIYWFDIMDTLGLTTIDEFKAWLADNNLQVVASLPTPIEIQLTPTQINTIIGQNNIFCDTGNSALTFKDLDLAKRGNFREVFKLPS